MKPARTLSFLTKDKKALLYLGLLWGLIVLAKLWYRQADADSFLFLLGPTAWGVSLFLGFPMELVPGLGYQSLQAGILITEECAGANFLLIATLAGFFALSSRWGSKGWLLPLTLLLAYALTVMANIARICCLLLVSSLLQVPDWLHLGLGAAVYLSLLIPYSLLLSNFPLPQHYANSAK